jgi:hypothetical protein
MLSPSQLRTWTTKHLNSGAWYLDCSTLFTPIQEMELKRNREAAAIGKDDQLMNKEVPWRGSQEKSPLFMQMLIEACSFPGDVVLDCTTATG